MTLTDRIALVTGAGSGIGAATARRLAAEGAFVWVTDRDEDAGRHTLSLMKEAGLEGDFHALEVSDEAACRAVAQAVYDRHGRLDVLVNNAGIGHVGTITQTTVADFDRLHRVNTLGVFMVTQAFIQGMIDRKRGSIVNVASIGGVVGIRDRVAYCATKFAVVGITKCMALDHALDGIRVNAVCPGRVETEFVQARLAEYPDPEAAYREMSATQAVGRMASPDEIADAVAYLAQDGSAFVTGTAFLIDGGWTAGK